MRIRSLFSLIVGKAGIVLIVRRLRIESFRFVLNRFKSNRSLGITHTLPLDFDTATDQ